ncbi:hypothetical protein C1645_825857 [Glomus cerebriforme]|uniref:Uncharacterized protein n=1 Tax=Glomus cerebriforme TaxID=658196 RepID=A0A397SY57_9GLOM|nr:hypothetical protein C1645_825857 [Glomus cerebriforme]
MNKLKYIGECLTLKVNKKLVSNIEEKDIDWEKTIHYIMNKEEGGSLITLKKDSNKRTYNIKNILEKLPMYSEMETQNNKIYESKCPRCRSEPENWTHIWNCSKNEVIIYNIIKDEIEIQVKELEKENIKVNKQKWEQRITEILLKRSSNFNGHVVAQILPCPNQTWKNLISET